MEFKIETNVPYITRKPAGAGRGRKPTASFPLEQMAVGASFLIACDVKDKNKLASWRRKFLNAKKRFIAESGDDGYKFKTSAVEGGIRVWRLA